MTISITDTRKTYTGNGSTTAFPVPFRFDANTDLQIRLYDASGAGTLLTETTHYSLIGAGQESGGTLSMVTAPASDEKLLIARVSPGQQNIDFVFGGALSAESLETAFDKLTMESQEHREGLNRTLKVHPLDENADLSLPNAADRANRVLGFDATGNKTVTGPTTDEVANAESYAVSADSARVAAQTAATNAAASETAAANSASEAEASKTAAAGSASAAAASASAAQTARTGVETHEANAAASAGAAATSEANAAASASSAATARTGSEAAETAAQASESAAAGSKNAAALSASNAATSETNAGNSASAAASSASSANTARTASETARDAAIAASEHMAWSYAFDSGTADADPGTAKLRFNHATFAGASYLYINETAEEGSLASAMDVWDDASSAIKATVKIRDPLTPSNWFELYVTGAIVDAGTYRKVPIQPIAANGSIANGRSVLLAVFRNGDAGTGAVDSFNGRTGYVLPTASDYDASQVDNDSAVAGVRVSDALNSLNSGKAAASHVSDTANPHAVTKAQIGLGNADNTSDAAKPVSTAQQAALDAKADASALTSHTGNISNPHSVTKSQVGLGNADNTSDTAKPVSTAQQAALDAKVPTSRTISASGLATGGGALTANRTITVTGATQAEAEAGTSDTKAMTPLRTKQAIEALASGGVVDIKVTEFLSSGTWTKDTDCIYAKVICVGGGGGASNNWGGGGAGGSIAAKWILASSLSSTEIVTIGSGGSGSISTIASAGGDTTFGSHLTGVGGNGGERSSGLGGIPKPPNGNEHENIAGGVGERGAGTGGASWGPGAKGQTVIISGGGFDAAANSGGGGGGGASPDGNKPGGDGGSGRCIVIEYLGG